MKVACFKTVFHRQINVKDRRVIPESEITRFSHQIPSYFLTGQESLNAPKGCCELDPTTIPDEFLQVIEVLEEEENIPVFIHNVMYVKVLLFEVCCHERERESIRQLDTVHNSMSLFLYIILCILSY